MESFEIKELYTLHGKPGLYKFVGQAKAGYLFSRLTEPGKVVLQDTGIGRLNDIRIYTTEGEVSVESVIDRMYEIADGGIKIPDNLAVLSDRWESVSDFMQEMVPSYDSEQFKPYHMEKVLKWYHEISKALDMLDTDVLDEIEEGGE
jgi:hypothetical protein